MFKKLCHILFFPALLAILIASNFLVDPVRLFNNDMVNTRNRNFAGILSTKEQMDVIVMGDSESYTSFSPLQCWNEYGIPVYNCGMQGQNIIETYSELKSLLKTQKPKVLLWEAYMLSRYDKPMKEAELVLAEQFYQLFPALRFHSSWRTVFNSDVVKAREREWPKGFHIVTDVLYEELDERQEENLNNIQLPRINLFYLDKILELCRKNDIKVVFYSSPSPVNYSSLRVEYIRNLAAEKGIPYVNLLEHMEEMELDLLTESYDGGDHLNLPGAQKTTSFLGKYLAEECGLESRKGDPAYENWSQEAKAYKKQVKERLKEWKKKLKRKKKAAEAAEEQAAPEEENPAEPGEIIPDENTDVPENEEPDVNADESDGAAAAQDNALPG